MANVTEKQYDVVVVGGGLAGVCAALAAARHGARTAIIQNRPVFGGNASSEIKINILGATYHGNKKDLSETGIIEEILLENKARNPHQNYAVFDAVLWEKVKFQENLDKYLNTVMTDVQSENDRITSVKAYQMTTEKTYLFTAKVFVDATGHGTLGYLAGAKYRVGIESKYEFNEPHGPEEPINYSMGNALMLQSADKGEPVRFEKPDWATVYEEDDLVNYGHANTGMYKIDGEDVNYTIDGGYWWLTLGGEHENIIADAEDIRDDLMKAVYGVWDHIKNRGEHGAENYDLTWVGAVPGTRDSRRLEGDYLLNENDVLGNRIFEDGVAYGGWQVDVHYPLGLKASKKTGIGIKFPGPFSIPYRSYYSKNISNLMMAGRDISATKIGMGSIRVMGTCAVGGQAVGTAAALAVKYGCDPRGVGEHITELQQTLLKDDCYIPGIVNTDPSDMARGATITASSHKPGCEPEKVISGVARRVGEEENCWESDGLSAEGETLNIGLQSGRKIKEIRLTFDPNLTNELMPSIYKEVLARQVKFMPYELVKDYRIELFNGEKSVFVKQVKDNIQRLNVIELPQDTEADSVRITVTATYGHPNARVFEVRVY